VLLHAASTILLFLALRGMTGALWRSAFAAAVFAIHPLHVESVAWVAERKDVLGGFFFILTLAAYLCYTRKPSPSRYAGVLLLFAAGLMAKSMLVTLPFVLLLLDYWPLGRFAQPAEAGGVTGVPAPLRRFPARWRPAVGKAPLFALSAAAGVIQMWAVKDFLSTEKTPIPAQISNALVSYAIYLGQMIYPAGLAVFYPAPGNHLPAWKVALALMTLASISAVAFAWRRKRPYLLVGWLWYLIMLAPPVIGFVQAGHAQSDRYTYLPQIGLYIAAAWLAADVCAAVPHRRWILCAAGSISIAVLMRVACVQTSCWQDSETLWNHAVAVTTGNFAALDYLGGTLQQKGNLDGAIADFQKALEIEPDSVETRNDLGLAFLQSGNTAEAIVHFQKALEISLDSGVTGPGNVLEPNDKSHAWVIARAHCNLANALQQTGRLDEAGAHYEQALEADPDYAEAHANFGAVLMQQGLVDNAIMQYQQALEINPGFAETRFDLASAFQQKAQVKQAIAQYQKAIEIKPDFTAALNNLAYLLATAPQDSLRNGVKAVELARRASQSGAGNSPIVLGTLAASYAECGRYSEAVATAQRAMELANSQSNPAMADLLRSQIALYETGTPFRDRNLGK
jgi:tetratricopeptide (TPR) repeat protein